MTFNAYYRDAWINLKAAKLRSFLAILGILVGTAAIVALVYCSQLATEKALAQFKRLGTNLLSISVYQQTASRFSSHTNHMTLAEWRAMPETVPGIEAIAPYATAYQPISYNGIALNGVVVGADEALADVLHIHLLEGTFVSFVDSFEHFCVIGSTLAQQLKSIQFETPIGKQLRIGSILYTIIGVAKPWQENGFFNEDINQAVIIPLAGVGLVNKEVKINYAILRLAPDTSIYKVNAEVKRFIQQQSSNLGLFIRSAKQIIESMEDQGRTFTLLLAVIGSISLLVGGIGIMNVMLVSVHERKKEIGIRKAIGAKNRDIQLLFLIEAILLSLMGGGLGVFLGLLFTWIVAYFSQWPFSFHAFPPFCGFMVSVATGIFFGYYPANRAARLEPIVSLRSEA